MKRLATTVIIAALLALPGCATPKAADPGILDEYHGRVSDTFKALSAPQVRLSAIFEPAFEPEFAVGLREEPDGRGMIVVLKAARQIWGYSLLRMMRQGDMVVLQNADGSSGNAEATRRIRDGLPRDPKQLQISTCHKSIDHDLALRIAGDWRAMMLKSQVWAVDTVGLDGEFFTFSMRLDGVERHARVWSPPAATQAGQLANLAYFMKVYCGTQSDADLNKLDLTSRELEASLAADARGPER